MTNANITFISAGAGSGKTHRLTEILYERLIKGTTRPEAVIATTFTKKAANELVERVRQKLVGEGALAESSNIGQSYIGTVNAVCQGLIERFAFEAGLSPSLKVIDEIESAAILREAIEDSIDPDMFTSLEEITDRLQTESWQTSAKKILDAARINCITPEDLAEHCQRSISSLREHLPKAKSDCASDKEMLAAIDRGLKAIAEGDDTTKVTAGFVEVMRELQRDLNRKVHQWATWQKLSTTDIGKKSLATGTEVSELAKSYNARPDFQQDIFDYMHGVFDVAAKSLANFQARKTSRGLTDFVDQERKLLEILDQPEVAEQIRGDLDLLLVDEFQDTSPIQLALFMKLAQLAKETIWVGDVKQAIYGFRGSDPELMNAVTEKIQTTGGMLESLGDSWRSRKELVSFSNDLFTPAFADLLPPERVQLKATRTDILGTDAVKRWELSGSSVDKRTKDLALAVTEFLHSKPPVYDKNTKSIRPLNPGDVAVLCRSNDDSQTIAQALESCGVPTVIRGIGLAGTPEVTLALACYRRVLDSSDTLAAAEILCLYDCQSTEKWLDRRLKYVAELAEASDDRWLMSGADAHPVIEKLEDIHEQLAFLSPLEALDSAIAAGEVETAIKRWGPTFEKSQKRLANIEALRGFAVEYQEHCKASGSAASPLGFLLWFETLASADMDEQAALPDSGSVNVMTYHKAKGLEWPAVILTDLHKEPRPKTWGLQIHNPGKSVDFDNPLKGRELRFWPNPFSETKLSKQIPLRVAVAESEAGRAGLAHAIEEEKRLLYVGITRARDYLIITQNSKGHLNWVSQLGAEFFPTRVGGRIPLSDGTNLNVPIESFAAEGENLAVPASTDLAWFKKFPSSISPISARFSPSDATAVAGAKLVKTVRFEKRVAVKANADMQLIGHVIHAAIAYDFINPRSPDQSQMIQGLMERFGATAMFAEGEVITAIEQFKAFINSEFSYTSAYPEYPIQYRNSAGQLLNGWIDLALETPAGWVVIDHKTFPGKSESWDEKSISFSGQLKCYADALELATNQKVIGTWIHFPVGGGMARVELP